VDSKLVEILAGEGGEGEEAGGHEVFLSQMRSDLVCLSLARPTRARRALSVDLTISTLAARCWYSKTLSGDERHYPHPGRGRPRGPYADGHLGMKSRGPTKAASATLPAGSIGRTSNDDRVPSGP